MASHEDETEQVVPDVILDRRIEVDALLSPIGVASDLYVLALERLPPADQVDRVMLRGPDQPGAGLLRHACRRPLLQRGDQGVLCELLGRPQVADDASQPGDEPGRLDPPYRFDRTMRLGGCRHIPSVSKI